LERYSYVKSKVIYEIHGFTKKKEKHGGHMKGRPNEIPHYPQDSFREENHNRRNGIGRTSSRGGRYHDCHGVK